MNSNYFNTRYSFDKSRKIVWKAICEYLGREIPQNAVVLELGAGYCDFINQIKAQRKYALDINPQVVEYCNSDVTFIDSSLDKSEIPDKSVDIVFASNLLEHLKDQEANTLLAQINRLLKNKGKVILIQPNYHYCYREYWDDFTHIKAYSHISLCDLLSNKGLKTIRVEKKFLPFSFKSIFPKSYWLTKLYLMSPWRPMAKQMLVVAQK